jgi:hypothetical protein
MIMLLLLLLLLCEIQLTECEKLRAGDEHCVLNRYS